MLTAILFIPVVAAAMILLLPKEREGSSQYVALAGTLATLAVSLVALAGFDSGAEGFQYTVQKTWVDAGTFQLEYHLGVDGLSLPLVVLTTVLTTVSVLISFSIKTRQRAYYASLMLLSTSVLGVFMALDLVLFFLFWELELFPMYLLISVWGSGRKVYSATKFVLFTVAGSAFMLVGILAVAFGGDTFDLSLLAKGGGVGDTILPLRWVFLFLFVGFAVKLPVVPVHTWLPDAHSDAPTAVSVMLAGVLLKMGGYGILRLCVSILPEQADDFSIWLAALGAASVLYGGFITLRQTDVKRLIAYSSVSHMGIVLLGIGALGTVSMTGATYQMLAHGLVTGLLFVMVGLMYERTHTREIRRLGGLARQMPLIAAGMVFAGMASLGLPSLAGFIAEVTVFLGSFDRYEWAVLMAIGGVVLSAGYILWTMERVMFGPVREEWADVSDQQHWWEHVAVVSLVALVILLGVFPSFMMDIITPAVEAIPRAVA
ncbi:MAG: NuoM family protein [Dehalococcoidia bacterium]